MLPNLEPFVGADSRLNRGLGCIGISTGSLRNVSWNGLRRKVLSWRTHEKKDVTPQELQRRTHEKKDVKPQELQRLDWTSGSGFKEGSCRSGRSSMVWVCWRVGWRRLLLQGIFSLSGDTRCCVRSEGGVESKTSFFIKTLSDEVGFGETGVISIVDITGSLTETARAVNFERRWARGQLGPKDSRSELREKERPNRKWSSSQREGRCDTCKRRPKRRILQHMVKRRKCSEGNSGSFEHEAKGQSESTRSSSPGRRSPTRNSEEGAGVEEEKCRREPSPSGNKQQPPWHKYLKETCTDPSCDCWHPPDCVKHNTKEGFNFGDKCAFLRGKEQFAEQEKNKRERKSDKASVAMVRIFQTVGICVSRDIDPLPEDTVGLTDVRRSILNKNGRKILEDRSQTAVVTTAELLCNSEKKGLLLQIIQKENTVQRSPCALTSEERKENFYADDGRLHATRSVDMIQRMTDFAEHSCPRNSPTLE